MTSGFLFFMCFKAAVAVALLCLVLPATVRQDDPPAAVVTLCAIATLLGAAGYDADMLLRAAGATS